MGNDHVSDSPYVITVDKKEENVTGQLTFGMPFVKDVSRIRKGGKRSKVLLRIVDFVTEKMILTEEGKLKKLSSENMITKRRITKQMAVFRNNSSRTEEGNAYSIDRNVRHRPSLRMSPLNSDRTPAVLQGQEPKRRILDSFRDKFQKVMVLCRFFVKRNPSHKSFRILHSAEKILDGRPVRLTDTTFRLIESALKYTEPETDEDNTAESAVMRTSESAVLRIERNLGRVSFRDKYRQILMTCDCITTCPHKRKEYKSHAPTNISFSKLMSMETNLSGVQYKGMARGMRLNTEVDVDNSGYDLNCPDKSTICYDFDHSQKHKVYGAKVLNEIAEVNDTKTKNDVTLSRGGKFTKLWDNRLIVRTPSPEVLAPHVPATKQYEILRLETTSTVTFPEQHTHREYAVLIPERASVQVTDHKLELHPVNSLIFMFQYFGVAQICIIKSVPKNKYLRENKIRRIATVLEGPDAFTSIEYEFPFESVCKQGATFISSKKGVEVINLLSSAFVPECDNYHGNGNESYVRLNRLLRNDNANELANYWLHVTTAFSSATGIEYQDAECNTSVSAWANFENTEICSESDKYLQCVKHPAQVMFTCEHSELQTEDEASNAKWWKGKSGKSSFNSTWSNIDDSIKAREMYINKNIPSDHKQNHMNSQGRQIIGTESTDVSNNANSLVMEIEEEDGEEDTKNSVMEAEKEDTVVFGSHIRQTPAGGISGRANKTNAYTLLLQVLKDPREDAWLQLGTFISLLAGDTVDCTRGVKPPGARILREPSYISLDMVDSLRKHSTAYKTCSSNDRLHLWSLETRFDSRPGVLLRLLEDIALHFESVLSDLSSEEVLYIFEQMLGVMQESNTSGNASVSRGREVVCTSPESCSTKGSTNAEDNKAHFCIEQYEDVGLGILHNESRNITAFNRSYNCRNRDIVQDSVDKRKQQRSENSNDSVRRSKSTVAEEIWGTGASEIKYDTCTDNYTPLYADLTSKLVKMRYCPGILPGSASIMTSIEEESTENDITERCMGLNIHLHNISESVGKSSAVFPSSFLTISEQQNEADADAEECDQPNCIILETNVTDMGTYQYVLVSVVRSLHSESQCCGSDEVEYIGETDREIMCTPAVTEDLTTPTVEPTHEINGNRKKPQTCAVKIQTRRRSFKRGYQSDKFRYNMQEMKNRWESVAQIKEDSSNCVPPGVPVGSAAASDANTRQKNRPNILDSFKSHSYILEVSSSIRLEPFNVEAVSSIDKNRNTFESRGESQQSPLAAFMNTVDTRRVTNSSGHSRMTESNVTDKLNLLLPSFITLKYVNTLHAHIQPPEWVKESDNSVTLRCVSKLLYNSDKSDAEFHREHENVNRDTNIITERQITPNITKRITSRRLQKFSEAKNIVLSVTLSENDVVNEHKNLFESEQSYTKLEGLRDQTLQKFWNNVLPCGAPSHVCRRISTILLSNTNIYAMGNYELIQGNETVNINETLYTSQKRAEMPVGKPETKLSLTKYSALQSEKLILSRTRNKNEISSLEDRAITARYPVTHSSQTDRTARSMPRIAGDISRAIWLPQPGVITTDMDILHPLVSKETDPNGSIRETRHDNKLSDKIYGNFGGIAKKVYESKDCFVCDTEYLESPARIKNYVRIFHQSLHQVICTNSCNTVAYGSKDNYVNIRETEMKIPDIISINFNTVVTSDIYVKGDYVNNDCKLIDPEYQSFTESMEELRAKIQNGDAIMELKTSLYITRNDFMRYRSNIEDSPTSEPIFRFPECMQVTQKKEDWGEKWMKLNDWQDEQVVRNYTHDYSKYQQCYTSDMNQWYENERQTIMRKREVNTRNRACPSPISCNKSAVAERRLYGRQKTTNKYLVYKHINTSRQKLVQFIGLMRTGTIETDGKCNMYVCQKGAYVHVDDAGITSVGEFHNKQVLAHYTQVCRYSTAALSANLTSANSPTLLSNVVLYKQPRVNVDKVDSYHGTVNNLLQNRQQTGKPEERDTSLGRTETKRCGLYTKKQDVQDIENDIYRAELVDITDDGHAAPTLQNMALLSSHNNSGNKEDFEGESHNRTGFSFEPYGGEQGVHINHEHSSSSCHMVSSKVRKKIFRELIMGKNDARTQSRLRFLRAKLFFEKLEQNSSQ
jgi:hypothetical protein